jgi:hypothetical protein
MFLEDMFIYPKNRTRFMMEQRLPGGNLCMKVNLSAVLPAKIRIKFVIIAMRDD